MTIALVGIIVVQVHWLKGAIELEEQQFHKNVLHAMNVSAQKIELKERTLGSKKSKIGKGMFFSIKTNTLIDTNFKSNISFELEEENIFETADGNIVKKTTQILRDQYGNVVQKSFNRSKTSSKKSLSYLKASLSNLKIGFSPFDNYRMLIEAVNPYSISEILKKELKNHGINTKFHIGLFSNNRLVVKEKGIDT